jgi:hypothetical protein
MAQALTAEETPFVCLMCGSRGIEGGDCDACALPRLDARSPEGQEAFGKRNDALHYKHSQRLLWLSVAVVVVLFVVANAVLLSVRIVIPGIRQFAVALLMAGGLWQGLLRIFPARRVG